MKTHKFFSQVWSFPFFCGALLGLPQLFAFNNDLNPDIIWRNSSQDVSTFWFLPQIRYYFTSINLNSSSTLSPPFGSTNWIIAATGDFNRDGQTDLVWRNPTTGDNVIWLMNGTTFVSAVTNVPTTGPSYGWTIVGTGDFNGDGWTDILWRSQAYNYTYIW